MTLFKRKIFKAMVSFLLRYYLLVIVLALVLAGLSWPRMVHLFKNISTDPVDLLPQDYLSVQTLLDIRDKFESKKRFGVVFESEDPEKTTQLLWDLKPVLEKHPMVGRVYVKKPGYDFFDKNKFLFLELEDLKDIRDRIDRKIQREKLGGFYISFEEDDDEGRLDFSDLEEKYQDQYGETTTSEYYVSPNQKVYALYVESREGNLDLAQEKKFQDEIRKTVEAFDYKSYHPTMKLYFGGSTRVSEYRALLSDLKTAGTISGLIIFLPLLLRFRRPQYVLLIFIPLIVGVPAGISIASLWVPKLNVTTSFLFAILGGLGVESGIHIFSRYYEKRKEGLGVESALLDIFEHLGPAVFTAVAALATTFLLMIFSDFRGFSEFGFISGVGLWVVFFLYFTFFPALLVLAEKIKLLNFKGTIREWSKIIQISPGFVKTLLVIFGLFTAFSIVATPKIKFEYDFRKIRAEDQQQKLPKLKQRLTAGKRINSPAVVLIKNKAEAEALSNAVESLKEGNPDTKIDYTSSVYSLVPEQQPEKLKVLKDIEDLLSDDSIKLVSDEKEKDLERFKKEIKKPELFSQTDVPSDVSRVFLGDKPSDESLFLIFAKPHLELDDGRNSIPFANELKEIKTPLGEFHASSSAIVFADVLTTMFRDSEFILAAAVLSIFAFVYLDFRNFKKSSLVMFSILAGVFWVMGVMYLLHIRLNLYNMVMIPAVMGMSVDNSIHVYHRYEELGRGSLSQVISTTGIAALLASLTNAAGFVGLAFCTHGGLRSMGVVAIIGLATCLITTLVFLPMILQFLEWRAPAFKKLETQEP